VTDFLCGTVQVNWSRPTDSRSTENARLENRKLFKILFKLPYLRFPPLLIRTGVFRSYVFSCLVRRPTGCVFACHTCQMSGNTYLAIWQLQKSLCKLGEIDRTFHAAYLRFFLIFCYYAHTRLTALFPGLPRWAGTRKVNQSGFYWSKKQWVAVASAGPYASLHLAPDR